MNCFSCSFIIGDPAETATFYCFSEADASDTVANPGIISQVQNSSPGGRR